MAFIKNQPQEKAKKMFQEKTAPVADALKAGTEKAKGILKGKKKEGVSNCKKLTCQTAVMESVLASENEYRLLAFTTSLCAHAIRRT